MHISESSHPKSLFLPQPLAASPWMHPDTVVPTAAGASRDRGFTDHSRQCVMGVIWHIAVNVQRHVYNNKCVCVHRCHTQAPSHPVGGNVSVFDFHSTLAIQYIPLSRAAMTSPLVSLHASLLFVTCYDELLTIRTKIKGHNV